VTTTPDEIRAEIEQTRTRLGHDLDELSDRVSPQKVAGRTAQELKSKVIDAGDALKPKVNAATEKALDTAAKARDTAGQAASTAQQKAHEQLDAHPQVADALHTANGALSTTRAKAGEAVTTGREKGCEAVSTGRAKAKENPRAAGSIAGGAAAALVTVAVLVVRRRRSS
jgi:hypothetical protein